MQDTEQQVIRPDLANWEVDLVLKREIAPLKDQARATIPLQEIATVEAALRSFVIQSDEDETTVANYLRKSRTWQDRLDTFWKGKKQFWKAIHTACCDAEKETAPEIGRIRTACETAIRAWDAVKEKRRREQQAILDRATEQQRQEAAKNARLAALSGDMEKASAYSGVAATVRTPVIMPTETKLDGIARPVQWSAECADPMLLLKSVAEGFLPNMHTIAVRGRGQVEVPLFEPNPQVLAHYAAKLGNQFSWPGVEVKKDVGFSARKL
jgi:hypothetical protein